MNEEERLDIIDAWHKGAYPDLALHEALGMTWEQYKLWVQQKTYLSNEQER